jgi:hypothetical protein
MCSKTPAMPTTFPEISLSIRCATGCRQYQEKGEVSGRIVEYARGVAHRDPEGIGSCHIYVVVANGGIRDDPKFSCSTCGQNDVVDAIGEVRDDSVTPRSQLGESVSIERVCRLEYFVPRQYQRVSSAFDQRTRDQDATHLRMALRDPTTNASCN